MSLSPSPRLSLVELLADALSAAECRRVNFGAERPFWIRFAKRLRRELSAAGLPAEALEGVLAGTHVVVPRDAMLAIMCELADGQIEEAASIIRPLLNFGDYTAAPPSSPDAKDADHD